MKSERVALSHRPHLARVMPMILLLLCIAAVPASASESKSFSLGIGGVLGGPLESDAPDPGLDNTGFSAHFSWRTQPQTKVVIRAAQVAMSDEFFGDLFDAKLGYLAVGGEYSFQEPYYVSGLYIGLGAYRLEGTRFAGTADAFSDNETSLGVVLGVTADFTLTESLSIFSDLSFHYADLQPAQVFGFLHVGVAYHF